MMDAEDARLQSRGRHYEDIHLEDSEAYQGEFTLHLDSAGNGGQRIHLDAGDLAELRAVLLGGERLARFRGLAAEWRRDAEDWDPNGYQCLNRAAQDLEDLLREREQ